VVAVAEQSPAVLPDEFEHTAGGISQRHSAGRARKID
jgi:hypothetical protein